MKESGLGFGAGALDAMFVMSRRRVRLLAVDTVCWGRNKWWGCG